MSNWQTKALEERIQIFEEWHGPICSPVMHAEFCMHMGRQSGKTTKLIEILPANEKAVLVTWNSKNWQMLQDRIKKDRPDIDIKNIKFVAYDKHNWEDGLKGYVDRDIYFDNEVLDMIAFNFVRKINAQYGKRVYNERK
jgi:hypothetical protein